MPKIIVLDRLVPRRPEPVGVGREPGSRSPHRPEGRRPAQGPAGGRRRHLPQRREDHRRRARRQHAAAGHRPGRRRRRQHRHAGRHAAGHRRDEHARRQHDLHRRAHHRPDAGPVAEHRRRPTRASSKAAGTARSSWARNWPARRWASSAWAASARPWPPGPRGLEMQVLGYDPFLPGRQGEGTGHRNRASRPTRCCRWSITSPSTRR